MENRDRERENKKETERELERTQHREVVERKRAKRNGAELS